MSTLPLDLLRAEFPDYLKVGRVYHWPRVPGIEWIETSWHNDTTPSWEFEAPKHKLRVRFWADYEDPDMREGSWNSRWAVTVSTEDGDTIACIVDTDDLERVQAELRYLANILGVRHES